MNLPTPPGTRHSTEDDLQVIAARLNEECRRECLAVTGLDPLASLTMDCERTIVLDGKDGLPVCALTVEASGQDCAVWVAIAGGKYGPSPNALADRLSPVFADLHRTYRSVHALVSTRNVNTARLLIKCGFEFGQRFEEFGQAQKPFNLYSSRSSANYAALYH